MFPPLSGRYLTMFIGIMPSRSRVHTTRKPDTRDFPPISHGCTLRTLRPAQKITLAQIPPGFLLNRIIGQTHKTAFYIQWRCFGLSTRKRSFYCRLLVDGWVVVWTHPPPSQNSAIRPGSCRPSILQPTLEARTALWRQRFATSETRSAVIILRGDRHNWPELRSTGSNGMLTRRRNHEFATEFESGSKGLK